MKKSVLKYDLILTEEDKEKIKIDYVENELSYNDIMKKYDIRSRSYVEKLLKEVKRTISEANRIAHKRYPEKFKHTEETKKKLREKRLNYMKLHPEKTAWRQKNKSYPEIMFEKFLIENGYASKYLIQREYSVFPYFIDFAFVDLKIAIEIDGSQHLEATRKSKDKEKDKLLQNNGWKVIRIAENIIKTDWEIIKTILDNYISLDSKISFTQVGIVKVPKKNYIKVERNENGRSIDMEKSFVKQRKTERPSPEELTKLLQETSFKAVGKKYGVSDNTIRKWCSYYRLSTKSKDYKYS